MNILIVEDALFVRDVLRKVCIEECHCVVTDEAGSVATALDLLQQRRPDVILLDIGLPDADGFTVAEVAARMMPSPRVLVISAHIDEYTLSRCEKLHVHGFIDKDTETVATLKCALTAVAQSRTYFSARFETARRRLRADPRTIEKRLSDTQQQVLSLIARGLSDQEIADCRGIATKTAEHHRTNILRRLGIPGTPKLIVSAIARGFGELR
jgi:DNA-binding NarL/FixJ family response regulator